MLGQLKYWPHRMGGIPVFLVRESPPIHVIHPHTSHPPATHDRIRIQFKRKKRKKKKKKMKKKTNL